MRHQLCCALSMCLSLALAQPSHAQLDEPAQTTLPRPPDHSIMLPLTTKSTYTYTQTSADGKSTTQKEENVRVNDSQGRQLTTDTVANSGVTIYTADDPLAGMRYTWSSSTKLAKALKYPEPVPGSRSCWKLPPAEITAQPGEPNINIIGTTCMPAEYPLQQPPFCKSPQLPTSSARDFPLVEVSAPSCASLLPGQNFQDLGTKSIRGFTAQGCRTTDQGGSQINETWWINLTSGTLIATLQLNSLAESRSPNGQNLKTLQDLNLLQVREPDPTTFRPPPDDEIKTVEMHEVPCDQTLHPD